MGPKDLTETDLDNLRQQAELAIVEGYQLIPVNVQAVLTLVEYLRAERATVERLRDDNDRLLQQVDDHIVAMDGLRFRVREALE